MINFKNFEEKKKIQSIKQKDQLPKFINVFWLKKSAFVILKALSEEDNGLV